MTATEISPSGASREPSGRPPCAAIRIVGVRGSTEPQHSSRLLTPVGAMIAAAFPGRISYTEVDYPATIERFVPPADIDLGESPSIGVANLITLLNGSARTRPDTCFVLLGYSQGAQVAGDALLAPPQRIGGTNAGELSRAARDRISAIALFGDPRFTKGESINAGSFDPNLEGLWPRPAGALDRFANRMRSYCSRDDVTCQGTGGTLEAHTAYFSNSMPADAAAFIVQRIRDEGCLS